MVLRTLAAMAWRNLWRHTRRSLITATAMAVGAALCMGMIAISDGMYAELHRVMVDQRLGHVVVEHPDYPGRRQMYDTVAPVSERLRDIERTPGVQAVSARLEGHGLLGAGDRAVGGQLLGVLPDQERLTTRMDQQLVAGEWLPTDAKGAVLLGRTLAEQLAVKVGDEVVVVTQAADGSTGNALYGVHGILRTGDGAFDRAGAMLHLEDLQDLLVLPDQAHRLTVLARDKAGIESLTKELRAALPEDVGVQAWWEASPQTAQMMDMQKVGSGLILVIVFTVAAFGVVNTMTMSVFERTRELGVLRALGMRSGRLVALVVLESFFLGCVAAVLGGVLGAAFDLYLIVYGIDLTGGMDDGFSFGGVNLEPILRGRVEPGGVVLVLSAVLVISVLASLWPAMRAARLRPVEAIRGE